MHDGSGRCQRCVSGAITNSFVWTPAAITVRSYSFNPLWTVLWTTITTIFQEKPNTYHISEPIVGRFSPPNLVLVRSLRSSFIDSFSSAKKRCNTSQGYGAFFGQSCDRDRFLLLLSRSFLPFFSFLILQQSVTAFLIIKTIILLRLAEYQIIITFLAPLSYPARPRWTQICVYQRAFMTLRVAQFSLRKAHLSFSVGPREPPTNGLRPRLWVPGYGSRILQEL